MYSKAPWNISLANDCRACPPTPPPPRSRLHFPKYSGRRHSTYSTTKEPSVPKKRKCRFVAHQHYRLQASEQFFSCCQTRRFKCRQGLPREPPASAKKAQASVHRANASAVPSASQYLANLNNVIHCSRTSAMEVSPVWIPLYRPLNCRPMARAVHRPSRWRTSVINVYCSSMAAVHICGVQPASLKMWGHSVTNWATDVGYPMFLIT